MEDQTNLRRPKRRRQADRVPGGTSGAVVLFQAPEALELSIALALLVAEDGEFLDRLPGSGGRGTASRLGLTEDDSEVVGAGEAVRLELREAAIAPGGGDLVAGGLPALGQRASHDRGRHDIPNPCEVPRR